MTNSNAEKHGLTAKLPDILRSSALEQLYSGLCAEHAPRTPTETQTVRALARHYAALQKIEVMEDATLRQGGCAALSLCEADEGDPEAIDAALTGAASSEAIERLTRYRRTHERAVERCLDRLADLKNRDLRGRVDSGRFTSEEQCLQHAAEFALEHFECSKCSHGAASWIPTARALQCRNCRRQQGLRIGTVMERSNLPLLTWVSAITALLSNPLIDTDTLSKRINVNRTATTRLVRQKILNAFASPHRSQLLAGFDEPS